MWYTLSRARITRSLLLKPTWHLAHLMPNSLGAQGTSCVSVEPAAGLTSHAAMGSGRLSPQMLCGSLGAAGDLPAGVLGPELRRRTGVGIAVSRAWWEQEGGLPSQAWARP